MGGPGPAPRPRGAGWDDDEDPPRRDLGLRPEVPNHGARPFLIGLPILLITIAAVAAIVIARGGDDSGPSSVPDVAPATVEEALSGAAPMLAGRIDPAELATASSCQKAPAEGTFDCAYGDVERGSVEVVWSNGTVTKRLTGTELTAPPETTDAVSAALTADDRGRGEAGTTYACATAVAINPDGSPASSGATGFRCAIIEKGKPTGERYVEFAGDGTAARDFLVPS